MEIGDAAVKAKTGKNWTEWFKALDKEGAAELDHKAIVKILSEKFGIGAWWCQMVTVEYERARGKREVNETASGFSASISKTLAAPVEKVYAAWDDAKIREQWLSKVEFTVRKATHGKSIRITWSDGSAVEARFSAKGDAKSQVTVEQTKLASAEQVAEAKRFWGERLVMLAGALEGFSEHPAIAHHKAIIANLRKNTGKDLNEWLKLLEGVTDPKKAQAVLQKQHGLKMATAGAIAEFVAGEPQAYDPAGFVEAMFSGAKSGLRPVYEELMRLAKSLGEDVTATPCKSFVPLRRRYVFAQIKASTNMRIDLGLALKDTKAVEPLIDTGGLAKGDRITHRIPITSAAEIDATVKRWLKKAYEMDA